MPSQQQNILDFTVMHTLHPMNALRMQTLCGASQNLELRVNWNCMWRKTMLCGRHLSELQIQKPAKRMSKVVEYKQPYTESKFLLIKTLTAYEGARD